MSTNFKTGEKGLALIIEFEGEILHVYDDGFGYPTAGVGHLLTPAEKRQFPLNTKITKEQSRAWLHADLAETEDAINESVTVPITQNQFDAMVALAFNIGPAGFKRSSVLRNLNNRKFTQAADAFLSWNKVKGTAVKGLTRRRTAERKLFLTPDSVSAVVPAAQTHTDANDVKQPTPQPANQQPPTTEGEVVPLVPVAEPVIAVPQISAEKEEPKEKPDPLVSIGNRATAVWASVGATIVAIGTWLSSTPEGIATVILIVIAIITGIYLAINAWRNNQKDKRDHEKELADAKLKADREERAFQLQLFTLKAAADPNLHSVAIAAPPTVAMPNSDPTTAEVQA